MKRIGLSISILVLFQLLLGWVGTPVRAESSPPSVTAQVPVQELQLDNGLRALLVPRPEVTTVAVGWVVASGSADDPPHQTGLGHLLEHLMFKGSRTVGTRGLERELEALAEVDRLWQKKRSLLARLETVSVRKRPKLQTELEEVSSRLQAAQKQASSLAFLGHYSFLYSQQGGTSLNANTYRDLTLYSVTLPREKLELWFWLESDRLLAPVFREFYKEVDVILEERSQRIESTPTGRLDEEQRATFWGDHPYSWNPMGHPGDLVTISREDARKFFRRQYGADRMTLVLVGGFDVEQVERWTRRYFGRLPSSAGRRAAGPIQEPPTRSEETRTEATCQCPPQVQILYPSARFGHPDSYALQLLAAVLNGRTGRLYRSLVVDQQIAFSAYAQQISWKQAGEFSFRAESKGAVDPETLIEAWDRQVGLLQTDPPSPAEIQRAMNRTAADAYRALKDPEALAKQLLIYQGLGDWRYINEWVARLALTSQDLSRIASDYLLPERRTVALYRRPPAEPEP